MFNLINVYRNPQINIHHIMEDLIPEFSVREIDVNGFIFGDLNGMVASRYVRGNGERQLTT